MHFAMNSVIICLNTVQLIRNFNWNRDYVIKINFFLVTEKCYKIVIYNINVNCQVLGRILRAQLRDEDGCITYFICYGPVKV